MKINKADFKHGKVVVRLDSPEDAWHLHKIVKSGDLIRGRAERKVKMGGAEEKGGSAKKTYWLEIETEKTYIDGESFRANGKVTEEIDDIPKGSHQSISLIPGDEATITKKQWGVAERKRLEQANEDKPFSILAVVFDREEAYIAKLTQKGFEVISHEKGNVQKKAVQEPKEGFFKELASAIQKADSSVNPSGIVLASPAFWKEYLVNELSPEVKKKTVLATVSSVGETSFSELAKRPELHDALANYRGSVEERLVEEALSAIRQDLGCYGREELSGAAANGNMKILLVSEQILLASGSSIAGEANKESAEELMENAERTGAKVSIITNDAAQKRLSAFKGIVGIKRWQA